MNPFIIIDLIVAFTFLSCKSAEIPLGRNDRVINMEGTHATAPIIVYKTTRDFSNLVPVNMNAERTKIVSYPAPIDLFYQGTLAKPTVLKNNYLLDNRGISPNVVFLKYTYEVYSRLKEAPTIEEMMLNIAEKYPLTEFIYCGDKSSYNDKDKINMLNQLIEKGFPNCKRIEITALQMNL
jgi:hypothetical protein